MAQPSSTNPPQQPTNFSPIFEDSESCSDTMFKFKQRQALTKQRKRQPHEDMNPPSFL
jgi:hypothetical protein